MRDTLMILERSALWLEAGDEPIGETFEYDGWIWEITATGRKGPRRFAEATRRREALDHLDLEATK